MTKKDYVKIASVIEKSVDCYQIDNEEHRVLSDLAQDLAVVFASDNDKFDQDRFLKACGL